MKKTTGRFDTREELCYFVWRWYVKSIMTQAAIARACRVSEGTVNNIMKNKEGYEDYFSKHPNGFGTASAS